MGGFGSGRSGRKAKSNMLCGFSVTQCRQDGILIPGKRSAIRWSFWGEAAGAVTTLATETALVVSYALPDAILGLLPHKHCIRFLFSECNYGGRRMWFECPNCRRRVGKLFVREERVICLDCGSLTYNTRCKGKGDRAISAMHAIERRLGAAPSGRLPERPKGMHWRTYEGLAHRHAQHGSVFMGRMNSILGKFRK